MLNPLGILKTRQLTTLPPHFQKVEIDPRCSDKVTTWITLQLEGRYFVGKYTKNSASGVKLATYVAFENQIDTTFFIMACPFINF